MTRILADKVVIVTGAGGSIGRAVSLAMAQAGARVVVNDFGSETAERAADTVVEMIRDAGGDAVTSIASVADPLGATSIIESAITAWGRVDAVVNNAGIIKAASFDEITPEDFDAVVKINLYGSYYVSHAAAAFFRQQNHGAFIHMTSSVGLIGSPALAGYAASKFGIVGLSRSISFDMTKFNVRSNCIAPAAFSQMTTLGSNNPAVLAYAEWAREHLRPEQNAPLAVFLASDAAADITGQIFGVRADEIYLYSQPRPIRTIHRDGWTPQMIAEQIPNSWRSALVPHETTSDVLR